MIPGSSTIVFGYSEITQSINHCASRNTCYNLRYHRSAFTEFSHLPRIDKSKTCYQQLELSRKRRQKTLDGGNRRVTVPLDMLATVQVHLGTTATTEHIPSSPTTIYSTS